MKEILKLAIGFILFPKRSWYKVFHSKVSNLFILKYVLVLALIGPTLSFFSMHIIEGIPLRKTVLYALATYFMDIISVYIFAWIITLFDRKISYKDALKISAFGSTAIWLSDIVDIHQILRPLSIIGFLYSLYLIYMGLKLKSQKDIKTILVMLILFGILYALNSLIAESIVQNPVVKNII